jgi:bacterioferritin
VEAPAADEPITRQQLINLLNDDLAREYQAVIDYVVYSQVLKGARYMNIAGELEKHSGQELRHALTVAKQIATSGSPPAAKNNRAGSFVLL